MSIAFNCPQCGKEYKVPDAVAGRKTPCRQCGREMIVPAVDVVTPAVLMQIDPAQLRQGTAPLPPPRSAPVMPLVDIALDAPSAKPATNPKPALPTAEASDGFRSASAPSLIPGMDPEPTAKEGDSFNWVPTTPTGPARLSDTWTPGEENRSSAARWHYGTALALIAFGAFCFIGGLIASIGSFIAAASSPGGGRYVVTWGAIVFGAFQLIRGFAALLSGPDTVKAAPRSRPLQPRPNAARFPDDGPLTVLPASTDDGPKTVLPASPTDDGPQTVLPADSPVYPEAAPSLAPDPFATELPAARPPVRVVHVSDSSADWVPGVLMVFPVAVLLLALIGRPLSTGVLGYVVWGLAGLVLCLVCYCVRHNDQPVMGRIVTMLLLAGGGFGIVVVAALGERWAWPDYTAWQEFAPRDSGCRVLMPGSPRQVTGGPPEVRNVTRYMARHILPTVEFGLCYTDVPSAAGNWDRGYDAGRDAVLRAHPGSTLVREKPILMRGIYYGREVVLRTRNGAPAVFRAFLVYRRLYELLVYGLEPDSIYVNQFFDSFELRAS